VRSESAEFMVVHRCEPFDRVRVALFPLNQKLRDWIF
jgi:hypothetical protein